MTFCKNLVLTKVFQTSLGIEWIHNDSMYVTFGGIRNTKTWSKSNLGYISPVGCNQCCKQICICIFLFNTLNRLSAKSSPGTQIVENISLWEEINLDLLTSLTPVSFENLNECIL